MGGTEGLFLSQLLLAASIARRLRGWSAKTVAATAGLASPALLILSIVHVVAYYFTGAGKLTSPPRSPQ